MRSIGQITKCVMIAAVIGLMLGLASQAVAKPLKVFILAGQSNMQGWFGVSTLDSMADDPKTAPILKEMRNADGKPRVCEKVWISSIGCAGDDTTEQKGKLTVGFGAEQDRFGPEFPFGIYMEKLLGEPILIIKTSWGGKSLHTDFRPPRAGPYVWSDFELTQCKRRGDDLEKDKAEKVKATGVYYRMMMSSGKLQTLCYKEEIEAMMRTPGFGGFQLLDLHDFPGQGTALVGILNAFWEQKGYTSPEEYRRFCGPTVPLARFAKRVWTSGEALDARIELAHFGESDIAQCAAEWTLTDDRGKTGGK